MSTNLASLIYKTATPYGEKLDAIPRQKMHYRVSAVISGNAFPQADNNTWMLTDAVSLPGHRYRTQTLNQYNRKRVVQMAMDYDPVQFSVVDTVDNSFLKLLIAYNNYYYGGTVNGGLTKPVGDYQLDTTVDNDFNFGYKPVDHTKKYFFESITIHREAANEDQQVKLIHPIFQSVQHDQLAYASGADAVRWNVSVEYEGIEYVGFASTNQFASTVGTDAGSTVQTSDATQPVTAIDGGTMQVVTDSSGNPVVDSSGNPVRQGTP
tara:strand:+ start:3110 stop:3904 length:795 start_codon:yes stop_codon:yes gene_type:complete